MENDTIRILIDSISHVSLFSLLCEHHLVALFFSEMENQITIRISYEQKNYTFGYHGKRNNSNLPYRLQQE